MTNSKIKHKFMVLTSITNSSENLKDNNSEKLKHSTSNIIERNEELYDTKCPICPQMCKGQKGAAIHVSKAHKTYQRKEITSNYQDKITKNLTNY